MTPLRLHQARAGERGDQLKEEEGEGGGGGGEGGGLHKLRPPLSAIQLTKPNQVCCEPHTLTFTPELSHFASASSRMKSCDLGRRVIQPMLCFVDYVLCYFQSLHVLLYIYNTYSKVNPSVSFFRGGSGCGEASLGRRVQGGDSGSCGGG